MRRFRAVRAPLFAVALFAVTAPAARALPIPIFCEGQQVGIVDLTPFGNGLVGTFTVETFQPSLSAAAAFCGESYFNWLQLVIFTPNPPLLPPLVPGGPPRHPSFPFEDPPPGGYHDANPSTPTLEQLWADRFPGYWNVGPPPPAGTPGYNPELALESQTDFQETTLHFRDVPSHTDPNQYIIFLTGLVSMNADNTIHSFKSGYVWTWTNSAGGGTVTSFQAIPEPTTGLLVGTGLLVLALAVRRRREHRRDRPRRRA